VDPARVTVLENWAPLADLPQRPRDNAWARAHGLVGHPVVLYSGTLGMKHDPATLASIAGVLADDIPEARVVIVSSGQGADWIAERSDPGSFPNLLLLPFQPFEVFADVLGAADVFVAVLEADASAVSVPSKVLAYLCAGRPAVLSVPADNLAAQIVTREGAGLVVPPGDPDALSSAVLRLLGEPETRERMGAAGRAYAERAFDLDAVADRVEAVLRDAVGRVR
jgi:glycosyltransferase involved in cell wall biosynthesis